VSIQLWKDGIERGQFMTAFVGQHIDLSSSTVLDVGCGLGGISLEFARRARRVFSADHDVQRLAEVKQRVRSQGVNNMHLLKVDGRALPFEAGEVDVVLLNGVLEYMGVNDRGADPEQLQVEALKEIRRVLRPGGFVYVGIENRNYPGYLNADVHCGLPLVSMAPRWMSNMISKAAAGKPFQHYIHSGWGLTRILQRAGFDQVDLFVPLFNYQYPIAYLPIDQSGGVDQWLEKADAAPLSPEYHKMSFGRSPAAKRWLFKVLGRTGSMKLLCPCFVALATTRR
jgi:ubiquinone/menaquinone biosynthesis C-methylase UbiE